MNFWVDVMYIYSCANFDLECHCVCFFVMFLFTYVGRGVWNVPYIAFAILFQGAWLKKRESHLPQYASTNEDSDMAFCTWMRNEVLTLSVSPCL